jgi:hypothetical protein
MYLSAEQVRLWNLRYLADQAGGISALAKRLDRPQPMISGYIGKNPFKLPGREFCATVERALKLQERWIDQPHPTLWRKIGKHEWQREITRTLDAMGETPGRSAEAHSPRIQELIDVASQLSSEDQAKLVRMAEVFSK